MPVQKFRTVEQAREALWGNPHDGAYIRQLAWLWAFSSRLARCRYPHGVYRYASIEASNLARETWEAESARRLIPDRTS